MSCNIRTVTASESTRVALYLRVSLDSQGDRLAVDRQREDCLTIAADRGWEVVDEYVDNSISASDKAKQRPAYDKLVKDFGAGRFDALVCYDLDRLTRQPRQLEDWIDAAEERGLLLVTANGEADLTTDGGRLFARIKASVARAEVERKSARQRRALQQRADKGRPPLGVRLTGYTKGTGELVESEAEVVAALFARFAAGDSLRGIAAWLNTQPLEPRHGKEWTPSTVRTMLTNPRYAGRAVYDGKPTGERQLGTHRQRGALRQCPGDTERPSPQVESDGHRQEAPGQFHLPMRELRFPLRSHSGDRYRCPDGHLTRLAQPIDDIVVAVIGAWLDKQPNLSRSFAKVAPRPRRRPANLNRCADDLEQVEQDYDNGLIDGRRYAVATEKSGSSFALRSRRRFKTPLSQGWKASSERPCLLRPSRGRPWGLAGPSSMSSCP